MIVEPSNVGFFNSQDFWDMTKEEYEELEEDTKLDTIP